MQFASDVYLTLDHHQDFGIYVVPILLQLNVYDPAHQFAHLLDDHQKHQKVMFHLYQSCDCHPDVFYVVRVTALPTFSSVLQVNPLFVVRRVAQVLDAFRVIQDQTSLLVTYGLVSAIRLNQKYQCHQSNLS